MTAPSPGIVVSAMENRHYPSLTEYVDAVAAALRTEYQAIVDRGLLLQIDAPDLAMERHTLFADRPLGEFLDWVELVVAPINGALDGIDPSRVRLHVCWGNYEGPHTHDVPLDDIQPLLYEAHVGALVVSMANARHAHEHRCFERHPLPDGMVLVTGVIDTTSNYVEHPEVVAERLAIVSPRPSATPGGSSPAPTAASTRRPASATSPRRSCGRSSRRCAPAPISPPTGCSEWSGLRPTRPAGSLAPPGATWHEPRTDQAARSLHSL